MTSTVCNEADTEGLPPLPGPQFDAELSVELQDGHELLDELLVVQYAARSHPDPLIRWQADVSLRRVRSLLARMETSPKIGSSTNDRDIATPA